MAHRVGVMSPFRRVRRWYLQFRLGAVTFDIDRIERELAQEFATEGTGPLAKNLDRLIAEREGLLAKLEQA